MTVKEFNTQLALGTLSIIILRSAAYSSKSTKLLTKLSRYRGIHHTDVCICLSENLNTPIPILRKLSKHPIYSIRQAAADNFRIRGLFYDRSVTLYTPIEKEQATE